jgi:hypothetical protein
MEKLPLITAYANGKTIQCKGAGGWHDTGYPSWTEPAACYRIKPEPREWTLYKPSATENLSFKVGAAHTSFPVGQMIRVREILD